MAFFPAEHKRSLVRESKVAVNIPPRAVNVVGGVLRGVRLNVEELNDEGWPLDAIGVGFAGSVLLAGVGEVDLVNARLVEAIEFDRCDLLGQPAGVILDQLVQEL